MNELSRLHRTLRRISRRRRAIRSAIAFFGLVCGVVWGLGLLFFLDWALRMSSLQRLLALGVLVGIGTWAWRRYVSPWLRDGESELDVALLVEKQVHLDTDLVAALQFERPEAASWGSRELEEAVMQRAVEITQAARFDEGVPKAPLKRRTFALAATLLVATTAGYLAPDYLEAFFRRLMFQRTSYPTATVIDSVSVGGRPLEPDTRLVRCPTGIPIVFEVTCKGRVPASGELTLQGEKTHREAHLPLEPAKRTQGLFHAKLDRLTEDSEFTIRLGDAETYPVRLELVPPPEVEPRFVVTPPDYLPDHTTKTVRGLRQVIVPEGARVDLYLDSNKPLTSATLTINDTEYRLTANDQRDRWRLAAENTPLREIVGSVHFSVDAVDVDGLHVDPPLQGIVRVKADYPPRVSARMLTKLVLPTAHPSVLIDTADDFGIARLEVRGRVLLPDGTIRELEPQNLVDFSESSPPKTLQRSFPLALETWRLKKGDRLQLIVVGTDYRGKDRPGKATESLPLEIEVTDRQGILAAMAEMDRESAEQLEQMIERQLQIGGAP
ncbi:hypothetical protein JCM19992_25810 [Thermostilla marina]